MRINNTGAPLYGLNKSKFCKIPFLEKLRRIKSFEGGRVGERGARLEKEMVSQIYTFDIIIIKRGVHWGKHCNCNSESSLQNPGTAHVPDHTHTCRIEL